MQLRAFNSNGMARAAEVLDDLRSGSLTAVPVQLLEDPGLTVELGYEFARPKPAEIRTRWQLGLYLTRQLPGDLDERPPDERTGYWSWLAFALFELIRPPIDSGRKIGEDARYLLTLDDYRKRYRHLLAGPYLMFRIHEEYPQLLKPILANPPYLPGDVYEQFASRMGMIQMRAALYALSSLYWDPQRGALHKGAAGSGPGSVRRLADVLMQFDLTFDLYEMDGGKLVEMLPGEFSRFRDLAAV